MEIREQAFVALAWFPKATVQAAHAGLAHAYISDLVALYPDDASLAASLRAASIMQTAGEICNM